jgi:SWI/SNF-related matrix-associated actin-dependent regulator of chromatin subfamily D
MRWREHSPCVSPFLSFCDGRAEGASTQGSRTLRLFVSHTVSGQAWQTGEGGPEAVNIDTGLGIPAWALKVEGRLLEVTSPRLPLSPR